MFIMPCPGYGGGSLSGTSELVDGEDVVDSTDIGDWFVAREAGESGRAAMTASGEKY